MRSSRSRSSTSSPARSSTVFSELPVWPATHYVTCAASSRARCRPSGRISMASRGTQGGRQAARGPRLEMRTNYDLEMLETMGFCSGIENYSRHLDGRAGEPPNTSSTTSATTSCCMSTNRTSPSRRSAGCTRATSAARSRWSNTGSGCRARSTTGPEVRRVRGARYQFVYVSATPGDYEPRGSQQVVEQIIRPTGLIDPEVVVRPTKGQVDDLIGEIRGAGRATSARSSRR